MGLCYKSCVAGYGWVWCKSDWMETGHWASHDAGGAGRLVISSGDGEVDSDETGDVGECASCLGGGPVYQVILTSVIPCGWLPINV